MNKENTAVLLKVYGTVQGVGFRPYVFILAKKYKLKGFVSNTEYGVEIFVEGFFENINKFIYNIKNNTIKIANVSRIIKNKKQLYGFKSFTIKHSCKESKIISDFPSDIAICGDCKKELMSRKDRRYYYPFINCTRCGPRYSIVKKLPYDRLNTTMKEFDMCPDCRKEYEEAENRRFHAQPDACSVCGPQVKLYIGNKYMFQGIPALSETARIIEQGGIVAIKSIGGYHLACNAHNEKAVLKLRKIKSRYVKPFAIMVKDIKTAEKLADISPYERRELSSSVSPIVILRKKNNINEIFDNAIARNNSSLGIMLPYTPVHYILFDLLKTGILIMTSANKNDEPIIYKEKDIFAEFAFEVDGILTNNREIYNPVDDSIVSFAGNQKNKIVIRRSRGYVPNAVNAKVKENIFAAGADIKNSFCITRKKTAYLSAYCGDMLNYKNLSFMNKSAVKFLKFLDVKPDKIAYDLHPNYNTSNYVKEKFKNKSFGFYPIQHHYAHIASVIAENNIEGNVLGFAYDGTGFGFDGKIWGSECLLFGSKEIRRLAHIEYFDLPGGDIAAKEIWRIAVSLFYKTGKLKYLPKHITDEKIYENIVSLLATNKNNIQTCSIGRLLDAAASLTGLTNFVEYEGQGAVHLESVLKDKIYNSYCFDMKMFGDGTAVIKINKIVCEIIQDLTMKKDVSVISGKLHETICRLIFEQAKIYSKIYKTDKIALSGGVFQNKYILSRSISILKKSGFKVYFNSFVPVNDGGIALGQSYICSNYKNLFV